MGRMNIFLAKEEDEKLQRLKEHFKINSKEETIMRLIRQFPEEKINEFDMQKETDIGDLI